MVQKKIISIATFGIFLILSGSILTFFKWPQANLIIAIGLLFEILAALFFIWKKLKNK